MFTAFAYWTAAWTRNAGAAGLTSLPLVLLSAVGPMTNTIPEMPDRLREILSLTPGAATSDLVRSRWFGLDGGRGDDADLRRDLGPGGRPAARDDGLDLRGRRARPALDALGAARLTT
jgi:hypothetical protein